MTTITKRSPERQGEIGGEAVKFIIEATFTNERVSGAWGQITEPRSVHDRRRGEHVGLMDKKTGQNYNIFFGENSFSFAQSYDKVELLFE